MNEKEQHDQYVKELHVLARAQKHITLLFGEEAGLDYMISECQKYAQTGSFSKHCYEYAEKTMADLSEEQVANLLPKNEKGQAIFSYKDL